MLKQVMKAPEDIEYTIGKQDRYFPT